MSVRSTASSVTVTVTYTEEHKTFLRGSSSAVTVSILPPYLFSFISEDYRRHPKGIGWSWRRTDGFTRSLPEDKRVLTRADGKMYVSVPITTKVDSTVGFAASSSQTQVDAKVSFGTKVSTDVDSKVSFAHSEVKRLTDGRLALSSDEVDVNVDGKITFAYGGVKLDVDAKTVAVHLSDLQWVNSFISQLLPEIQSSSQVWMLPIRIKPHDRVIVTLPPLPKKYVVIFQRGVLVHEYVTHWNYIGSSGDELPAVFQLSGNATRLRLINSTDKEAFVVAVAYKP